MSKHTPGPWNVTTESFGRIYVSTIIEGSVSVVSECWPVGYYKNDEQEANARLMAAAPYLLAALTGLYALVKGECPSILDEDSGGFAHMDRQIVAAIEKATGDQS